MLTRTDVTYDAWLAGQLGRACYHVDATDVLDNSAEIHARLVEQTPSFAWTRVPTDALQELHALTRMGFRLVDTTITLRGIGSSEVTGAPSGVTYRSARPEDEDAVAHLAARAFRYSRFHLDPQITEEEASRIKEAWIRNFFRGERGDAMIVGEAERHIIGFLLAIRTAAAMVIDLVAVDDRHRGKGVAHQLTRAGADALAGIDAIEVGTQAANVQAIRCYERMQFLAHRTEYVLHFHHWM